MGMASLEYFDYRTTARDAGIDDDQLRLIEKMFRADYPSDDMLYELHVLRACQSIRDGLTTLDAVLRDARGDQSSAA